MLAFHWDCVTKAEATGEVGREKEKERPGYHKDVVANLTTIHIIALKIRHEIILNVYLNSVTVLFAS